MVVGPDGFDLLGCDRVPPGTQSLANGARLVFWMMKEIDENVDDTSGMQFLGSRWRGEFLSFRHRLPRNCIPLVSSTFSSISFIIQKTRRAPFASDCVPGGTRSHPSRSKPSGPTTI